MMWSQSARNGKKLSSAAAWLTWVKVTHPRWLPIPRRPASRVWHLPGWHRLVLDCLWVTTKEVEQRLSAEPAPHVAINTVGGSLFLLLFLGDPNCIFVNYPKTLVWAPLLKYRSATDACARISVTLEGPSAYIVPPIPKPRLP